MEGFEGHHGVSGTSVSITDAIARGENLRWLLCFGVDVRDAIVVWGSGNWRVGFGFLLCRFLH